MKVYKVNYRRQGKLQKDFERRFATGDVEQAKRKAVR